MVTLSKKQQDRLHKWFLKQKNDKSTTIINLTLTFDDNSLENLKNSSKQEDIFRKVVLRFMVKLAQKLKSHIFGYIARESLSLSRDSIDEIVRPHFHILMAVKFDNIAYNITRDMIHPLWRFSNPKQITIQSWDGNKELIKYNYGHTLGSDNFHEVIATRAFHPRKGVCRRRTCETCNSYPSIEEILGKK